MVRSAPKGMTRRYLGKLSRLLAVAAAFLSFASLYAPAHAALSSVQPRLKPEAPGPTYLSSADKEKLLAARAALKARRYPTAISQISLVSDPIARGLGEWMYFMAEDPSVDFNVADSFLDSNPNWPARSRIHRWIEKKIPNSAPADQVLAFFDSREPVTGAGKLQLARALFSVGDKQGGEYQIRDAWINSALTLAEEKRILSNFGGRLTKEDHAARVDRLLWGRQVTNARRVFPYLDSNERKKAEARAALLLQASSAQRLFDRLPEDAKADSGMLHAAVRYHRRRGAEQYALALAQMAPEDPAQLRNGVRWWDERNLLMRWALKNGRFVDAYNVAAGHRLSEGGDYAEAEFYAGWIALRFLDDPARAETHFLALASAVGSPISVSRAQYWLGRAAEDKGDVANANAYYANASQYYYSYYGQLAAEKAGGAFAASTFEGLARSTPIERALFASRPTVAALRMLTDLDLDYEFMVFAYHVDDQLERPGEYLELAKLANGEGAPHLTVRAGKVAIQKGAFTPQVAYPVVFVPDEAKQFVSPEIILGLSRQESEFNPRAYSRAGARGVMQLIPSTAQITARKEGLLYSRTALLDDPLYNMTIGSAHLSHLLERFDGSLVMTLAAYNAGAARVDQWTAAYGDPRSDSIDPLDWVELIPFSETRNYVQRVLENVQIYRGRLNDKPIPGRLHSDIERGGARNRISNALAPVLVLTKTASRTQGQTLPPIPERTVARARQYAMQNPPRMPGDVGAPLSAPDNSAAAVSPIVFGSNLDNTKFAGPDAQEAEKRSKLSQPTDALPVLTPIPNKKEQSPTPAAQDASPLASQQSETDLMETEKDVVAQAATLRLSATQDANDLVTVSEASAIAQDSAEQPSGQILVQPDTVTAPELVAGTKELANDLSEQLKGTDYCLAYQEFLARNAEKDSEATDLNASMLTELQHSDDVCDQDAVK